MQTGKRFGLFALVCALVLLGVFLNRNRPNAHRSPRADPSVAVAPAASTLASPSAAPNESTANPQIAPTKPETRPRFVSDPSPQQRQAGLTNSALQAAGSSLRSYRIALQENPVGTNAEITAVLLGKNPRAARYLPANASLNAKGELTDRWHQPLFFHQLSAQVTEIRSAGPDQRMWTDDDEVLR